VYLYGVHDEDGKLPVKDGVVSRVHIYTSYNIIIAYFYAGIYIYTIYVEIAKNTAENRPPAAVDKPIRKLMNFRYSREVQLLFHRT